MKTHDIQGILKKRYTLKMLKLSYFQLRYGTALETKFDTVVLHIIALNIYRDMHGQSVCLIIGIYLYICIFKNILFCDGCAGNLSLHIFLDIRSNEKLKDDPKKT